MIEVVAGQSQTGEVGKEVPVALAVRVTDAAAAPLAFVAVTFKRGAGGS